mgnify:CR=1 FL=1
MQPENKSSNPSGQPLSKSNQDFHLTDEQWNRVVEGAKRLHALTPQPPKPETEDEIKLSQMD